MLSSGHHSKAELFPHMSPAFWPKHWAGELNLWGPVGNWLWHPEKFQISIKLCQPGLWSGTLPSFSFCLSTVFIQETSFFNEIQTMNIVILTSSSSSNLFISSDALLSLSSSPCCMKIHILQFIPHAISNKKYYLLFKEKGKGINAWLILESSDSKACIYDLTLAGDIKYKIVKKNHQQIFKKNVSDSLMKGFSVYLGNFINKWYICVHI